MTGHSERVSNSANDDDGENDMVDDDASAFYSQSIDESNEDYISPGISARPDDDPVNIPPSNQTQNGPPDGIPPPNFALPAVMPNLVNISTYNSGIDQQSVASAPNNNNTNEYPTIPKGRSKAHHLFNDRKIAFMSFDIETGGEYCGILQLSAEFF